MKGELIVKEEKKFDKYEVKTKNLIHIIEEYIPKIHNNIQKLICGF